MCLSPLLRLTEMPICLLGQKQNTEKHEHFQVMAKLRGAIINVMYINLYIIFLILILYIM